MGLYCCHSTCWTAPSLKWAVFFFFFFCELFVGHHLWGRKIYLKKRRKSTWIDRMSLSHLLSQLTCAFGSCLSCWCVAIAQEAESLCWTHIILKRKLFTFPGIDIPQRGFSLTIQNSFELISICLLTESHILCQIYFTILLWLIIHFTVKKKWDNWTCVDRFHYI